RAPDHGAGAEHVVSGNRPQSAKVHREYLSREGLGLPAGGAARLSLVEVSLACDTRGAPAVRHPGDPLRPSLGVLLSLLTLHTLQPKTIRTIKWRFARG